MVIDRLLEDHARLRELSAELSGLLRCVTPCGVAALADCRWRIARMILRHLPVEDREVYQRLENHPKRAAVDYAARSKVELDGMYRAFQGHTDAWTSERIASDWTNYRHMALGFQSALLARLAREEADLYPLVEGAPPMTPQRRPEDRNWAGDGWTIKAKIAGP